MPATVKTVYQITTRMNDSIAFYGELLGMPLKFHDGNSWAQFDAGGTSLALSSPEEAAPGATGTVVVLEVDNLEEVRKLLEGIGASVTPVRDMGDHGRVMSSHDPDGNVLQIFEKKPA